MVRPRGHLHLRRRCVRLWKRHENGNSKRSRSPAAQRGASYREELMCRCPQPAAAISCVLHIVCSSAVPHTMSTSTHSCTRGTRSAGPDGPNGTQTKELASVSQNGFVYLVVRAGLVTSLSRGEPFRSDTIRVRRGVDRRGTPRIASLAICIFDFMTPQSRTLSESGLW